MEHLCLHTAPLSDHTGRALPALSHAGQAGSWLSLPRHLPAPTGLETDGPGPVLAGGCPGSAVFLPHGCWEEEGLSPFCPARSPNTYCGGSREAADPLAMLPSQVLPSSQALLTLSPAVLPRRCIASLTRCGTWSSSRSTGSSTSCVPRLASTACPWTSKVGKAWQESNQGSRLCLC